MLIQVLGTGCKKCQTLKDNAEAAVAQLGIDATVEKVEDIMQITSFGVMMTPALVIDGDVKIVGKVPAVEDIVKMLS